MKKIISTILCMTVIFSMNMSAFAITVDKIEIGQTNQDVVATYEESENEPETVKHVSVEWSGLEVTYVEGDKVWNSEELKYEYEEGTWEGSPQVKITNKSNESVYALVSYYSANYSDITMVWNTESSHGVSVADGGTGANENFNEAEINMMSISYDNSIFPENDGVTAPYITLKGELSGDLTSAIENYEKTSGNTVNRTTPITIGQVLLVVN